MPVIVASVNANKRLGTTAGRERFRAWLERWEVMLVVVQEGWRAGAPVPAPPPGMRSLDGDAELAVWIRGTTGWPRVERPATWWQTVFVRELAIHSVHLDPNRVATRIEQLQILAERLPTGDNVVLGDFNLAPRPVDGIYGTSPSRFTAAGERRAFAELLAGRALVDATAGDPPEFTLSRQIRGLESSFRCDLALLPASWPTTSVVAAHETRTGPGAFTDHSGIIVRAGPVADRPNGQAAGKANRARQRSALRGGTRTDPTAAASFKTAIARRGPSAPATVLTPFIERVVAAGALGPSVQSILDYGCGRGADVDYFRSLGINAVGYDPHVPFGFAEPPTGLFMVVTLIFVLNVLPTVDARLEVLRRAAARLAPDGVLIVATRSSAAVRNEAARSGWRAWGDGFVSHEGRGTFQHGMDTEELAGLGEMLGLRPQGPLPTVRDASLVALTRSRPRRQAPDHGLSPRVTEPGAAWRRPDRQTRRWVQGRAADRFSDHSWAIRRDRPGEQGIATVGAGRTIGFTQQRSPTEPGFGSSSGSPTSTLPPPRFFGATFRAVVADPGRRRLRGEQPQPPGERRDERETLV